MFSKECDAILCSESDSGEGTWDDLLNIYELQEIEWENENHLIKNQQDDQVRTCVLVKFCTKSTKKHFVDRTLEVTELIGFKIKFNRKREDESEVEDEYMVAEHTVLRCLRQSLKKEESSSFLQRLVVSSFFDIIQITNVEL